MTIVEGGEFGLCEEFLFKSLKPCTTHEACNDNDLSTTDECLLEASTCLCKCNDNCEDHGQIVIVNLVTGCFLLLVMLTFI